MTRFVIGNVGVFPFSGSAEVTGNLQVSGAGNHPGAVLEVMGPATGPGLRVTGNAEITGDLLVKGTTVTVDSATNLKVEGELSSSGPLVVTGQSQLKGALLVSGAATFTDVISSSAPIQTSAEMRVGGTLHVSGATNLVTTNIEGILSSSAPIQTSDELRVGEDLFVSGTANLKSTTITGLFSSSAPIQTTDDLRVGEALFVSGAATIAGAASVASLNVNDGNITNAGIIEADTIQSDADAAGLNINFDGNTGTNKLTLKDNLANALDVTEASNSYLKFTTTNNSEQIAVAVDLSSSAIIQTSNELRVGEDLSVSGNILNASFSGDANFINDVSISGSLFISSSVASGSSYPLLRIDHHNLTGSVPVLFVTGSGIVGIGTDDPRPDSANTNALHILGGGAGSDNGRDPVINTCLMLENNDHVGIQFMFPNQKAGQITWGTATSNRKATFYYDSNHNVYNFEGTSYGGSRAVQFHAGADGVNIGSSNAAHMANNKKKASLHISSSTKGIDTGGAVMLRIDHAEAMISGSLTNNTGTIMLVTGSGRVGILTETPQEALDVGDNSDVSARIGRAHIGYDGTVSDYAIFAHRDNASTSDYALQQRANGTTVVNAKSGQSVSLRVANQNALVVAGASNNNVGFGNLGSPIARVHITGSTPEQRLLRVDGMNNPDNPALFVTGTGHVGIRTASPTAVLSIVGDLSASTNIQAAGQMRVGDSLVVSGAINGASLAVGSIDVNDGNIANVGDIDADSVSVADAANGLNIDFSGANTGTGLITIADDLAAALTVKEGSNEIVKIVSSDGSEEIVLGYKLDLGDNDIENVGTISADVIQPDAAGTGLDIQFEGNTSTNKISLTDNLADALNITQAGNSYMKFITANNEEEIKVGVILSSSAPIQTSDVVRVGESLFVSASIALGDTAGTSVPPTSGSHLHIRSSNDAAIRIEADTDNADEGHNAYIFLTQDGGGTRGIVGLNGNAAADPAGVFLANAASNAMIVGARTAGSPLQLATNNRVKMTITDDGLVGLGQDFNGTINPVALLHISGGGDDQGSSANAPMMRVDYGDLDNIFHISRSGSVGVNVVPTHALTVAGDISGSTSILSKKDLKAHDANIEAMLKVSGNVRLGLSSSTAVTVNTDTLDSYKAPQFYILSGTTTVKLPGNHPAGTWFVFKAGNAHFGPTEDRITLSATAGDTIDGSTTHTIQSPFASVNCVSDGANWFIW